MLDSQALGRLRELDPDGRAGILQRVLRTFDSSLQRLMLQFETARDPQDLAVLRYVAHTVRSSSASLGALDLSQCCLEVETRIREGRTDDLAPALQAMAEESTRAAAAVRAMLAAPGKPE